MTSADSLRRRLDALDGTTGPGPIIWLEEAEGDPTSHAIADAEEARVLAANPRAIIVRSITVDGSTTAPPGPVEGP